MLRVFENQHLNLKMQTIIARSPSETLYFKAKEVARALGYENTLDAIARHVPDEYKTRLCDIRVVKRDPSEHPHSMYVTEPGLYELVFGSHLPAAKEFKRWVFEEVLPSIRKTGEFKTAQMFKIENEFDLHKNVVDYNR